MTETKKIGQLLRDAVIAYKNSKNNALYMQKELDKYKNPSIYCVRKEGRYARKTDTRN